MLLRVLSKRMAEAPTPVSATIVVPEGAALDVELSGLTLDSRNVRAGWLFCCVPGRVADGHRFAPGAVANGAVALLVERETRTTPPVPQLVVPDVRAALGTVASTFHDHPSASLDVIGITGTNGKTTTTYLLASILREAGRTVEVLGTLTQTRTTPEAPELQELLAAARDRGADTVVMEVSSHALELGRVNGIAFRLGVFTNLTQDHLDFHETMEGYFRAKARLFEPDRAQQAVVNADDTYGRLLVDAASVPTTSFHLRDAADLETGLRSSRFVWRGETVDLPLGGRFNVANALAAASAAEVLGIDAKTVAAGLAVASAVPGRFEVVPTGEAFDVIVDYAHTPDGLARLLESTRALLTPSARLIVVFGCGGDRDRAKRPLMGALATELADLAVLTSDNPRSEDPASIIDETRAGAKRPDVLVVEPDRRKAIDFALDAAEPGDAVVVAGKGHEQGQEINGVVHPFDDRLVVMELVEERRRRARGGPS